MNSFTKKLVLYCTGVIFLSFLVVYFLFNTLVSSYIRDMAERELAEGMQSAIYMTSFIPNDRFMRTVVMEYSEPEPEYIGSFSVRWHVDTAVPSVVIERAAPTEQFEMYEIDWIETAVPADNHALYVYVSDSDVARRLESLPDAPPGFEVVVLDDNVYLHQLECAPEYRLATSGLYVPPTIVPTTITRYIEAPAQFITEYGTALFSLDSLEMGAMLAHGHVHMPYNRMPSIVNANMVMLNADNEIIAPFLSAITNESRAEIELLVGHYLANQNRLAENGMTMVSGATSTHFMQTLIRPMPDGYGSVSILLYADISSAVAFQSRMNDILIALLAVSGLFGFTISVIMSAKFKRSVGRLCRYADAIGRGKWNTKAGIFVDSEFKQLSDSMKNMSAMLQSYENNQKQFFQNVSHELRTPLMSIQGYAEGILSDVFPKDEAAEVILAEGQKVSAMVSELLYISRMGSGSGTTEYVTSLDAKNLLHECLESIMPIAKKSCKEVTIDMPEYDIIVNADEEQLQRAVLNVLSNAVRHAKSEVGISCYIIGRNTEISIWDDGDGINPGDLPHIFKRFYKGENGNHGLGLAISHDIITNLGGRITAENTRYGAVFVITIPQN